MRPIICLLLLAWTFSSISAQAASGRLTDVTVTEIFVETRADPARDGQLYGGCMIRLSSPASTVDPSCTSDGFVTLACDGTFAGKSAASKAFELAQMAYVIDKPITVWIEGARRINGYCYASYVWTK